LSGLAVIVNCLLVYGILATGYHFFLEPVVKSSAVNRLVPEKMAMEPLAPAAAASELRHSLPPKQSPSAIGSGVAAALDAPETSADVAPNESSRKQAARTVDRRERARRAYRSPFDFAWHAFSGFRF
jgi:hypothetical protein